jgi:hypothetical protein
MAASVPAFAGCELSTCLRLLDTEELLASQVRCAACKAATFCNKACMSKAWDEHRPVCKATQKRKAQEKADRLKAEKNFVPPTREELEAAAAAATLAKAEALPDSPRYDVAAEAPQIARWYAASRAELRVGVEAEEPAAMYVFALRLYRGEGGVKQSFKQAWAWFKLAAAAGFVSAQGALGTCLLTGNGTERDDAEALRWYRAAAEAGLPSAMFAVGDCLDKGLGVPAPQPDAARAFYERAAAAGNEDAKQLLNFRRARARELAAADAAAEASLTLLQRQQRDYLRWLASPLAELRDAAQRGDAAAQCCVGFRFYAGKMHGEKEAAPASPEQSRSGSPAGRRGGAEGLGLGGGGGPPPTAAELKAAEEKAKLTRPDFASAAIWYRRSAEQGFHLAQGALACMLFEGRGVPKKSFREGAKLYLAAAEGGLVDAMFCAADSLEFGRGLFVDVDRAVAWYRRAVSEGGCARSRAALARLGLSLDGEKERREKEAEEARTAVQRAKDAAARAVAAAKRAARLGVKF